MQFITSLLKGDFFADGNVAVVKPSGRLRVGILGTGKIGTDLLIKIQRSPYMECVIFAGRNLQSAGMQFAAELGVPVSDNGVGVFFDQSCRCDIVFDATSAAHHIEHAQIFDQLGIFTIDLTPSQIGECCVPALGMSEALENKNISMISCGGQSSIPLAQVLARHIPNISRLSVRSVVSPDSIGPGTLANIDEYYRNTRAGLYKYTGIGTIDIELISDEIHAHKPMLNTLCVYADTIEVGALHCALLDMEKKVQAYVPGYRLQSEPVLIDGGVQIDVTVEGIGDYLPTYAGNLDIINCAAIAVAEHYAQAKLATHQHKAVARRGYKTMVLDY